VFFAAFLKLQFGFVTFWQRNIGAKAVYKMLAKLTQGLVKGGVTAWALYGWKENFFSSFQICIETLFDTKNGNNM